MARRLTGRIVSVGEQSFARGDIRIAEIRMVDDAGTVTSLVDLIMDQEVAALVQPGAAGTIYYSKIFSTIYGVRLGKPLFKSSFAGPLMLLMSIGLLFGGLATSVFLFPILVALAGVAGICLCLDARSARRKFRRDLRKDRPA